MALLNTNSTASCRLLLYSHDDVKPATELKQTKRITTAVPRAPRLAGERKPKHAKINVINVIDVI